MLRRGHPTAEDQLFPYGEDVRWGGHKETWRRKKAPANAEPSHACAQLPTRAVSQLAGKTSPEWISPRHPLLAFSALICDLLDQLRTHPYKSAVRVKWPRAEWRWVRLRLIRARQRLIKCSCCRPERWCCHLTPPQPPTMSALSLMKLQAHRSTGVQTEVQSVCDTAWGWRPSMKHKGDVQRHDTPVRWCNYGMTWSCWTTYQYIEGSSSIETILTLLQPRTFHSTISHVNPFCKRCGHKTLMSINKLNSQHSCAAFPGDHKVVSDGQQEKLW